MNQTAVILRIDAYLICCIFAFATGHWIAGIVLGGITWYYAEQKDKD